MRKYILTLVVLACTTCKRTENHDADGIFSDFHKILLMDDYEELANRLHPEVLERFRRRVEFIVSRPREGSWFTGTMDRQPTKDELSMIDDRDFFVSYMNGNREPSGNPFIQEFREADVIASAAGRLGFRQFVIQTERDVGRLTVFAFHRQDGVWLLCPPSMVDHFANRLSVASGGSLEVDEQFPSN